MATRRAPPTVKVPVLSNITVCVRARASKGVPPLIKMPTRAACATPAMNATGAAKIEGHGVAATRTARPRIGSPRQQPRRTRNDKRDWKQQESVPIRAPYKRCLCGLRRVHHSHNAGVRALPGSGARSDFECLASIDGSAARGLSGPTRNRDRFAGQRRLIDHRSIMARITSAVRLRSSQRRSQDLRQGPRSEQKHAVRPTARDDSEATAKQD